jgi:hypothetical protein
MKDVRALRACKPREANLGKQQQRFRAKAKEISSSRRCCERPVLYAPGVSNADIGMTGEAFNSNRALPVVYDGYTGGSRTAYIIIVASDADGQAH